MVRETTICVKIYIKFLFQFYSYTGYIYDGADWKYLTSSTILVKQQFNDSYIIGLITAKINVLAREEARETLKIAERHYMSRMSN